MVPGLGWIIELGSDAHGGAGPGDPSPIWFQSAGIELLFLCPWAGSRKPY